MYVEVKDDRSGKSFRFYDFEYAVARKLNGRPLADVARDLRSELQLELTAEQLEAFSDQLRSLGFLEHRGRPSTFFPPLVDDESGEFEMPNLAAAAGPPRAADAPPLTPGPLPMSRQARRRPARSAAARSLTENTITAYPPEVDPAHPAPPPPLRPPRARSRQRPSPRRPSRPAPRPGGPGGAGRRAVRAGHHPRPAADQRSRRQPGQQRQPVRRQRQPAARAIRPPPSCASADLQELTDELVDEPEDTDSAADDAHAHRRRPPAATPTRCRRLHVAVTAAGRQRHRQRGTRVAPA